VKANAQTIIKMLEHGGMSASRSAEAAPLIIEFFEMLHVEPQFSPSPRPPGEPQFEFATGDKRFSVEYADTITWDVLLPPELRKIGGTWLETAPLTYLARVCIIGRRVFRDRWPRLFAKRLRNPPELLDVLNEVWSLSRWPEPSRVSARHRPTSSDDDIDWRFFLRSLGIWINLEVKRRCNDLLRLVHPDLPPTGLFDKAAGAFARSKPDELNVIAVTLYAGITDPVLRAVDDFMRSPDAEHVDGIVLWSVGSNARFAPTFERFRNHREIVSALLSLDPQDVTYGSWNAFPISMGEAISGICANQQSTIAPK
jgi:hypothetical protein